MPKTLPTDLFVSLVCHYILVIYVLHCKPMWADRAIPLYNAYTIWIQKYLYLYWSSLCLA